MWERASEFLEAAVGPFLVAAAFTLMAVYTNSVESTLSAAGKSIEGVTVARQYSEAVYSDVVDDYRIVSEILSKPSYSVVVLNNSTSTQFRSMGDGSVLVKVTSMNAAPGVEAENTTIYQAGSQVDFSSVYGKYSKKIEYDDKGRVTTVSYVQE